MVLNVNFAIEKIIEISSARKNRIRIYQRVKGMIFGQVAANRPKFLKAHLSPFSILSSQMW
jgi:hypothetical protein